MDINNKIKLLSEEDYTKLYGDPDWTGVDYDDHVYVFIDENNLIIGDCVLFNEINRTKIDNFEMRFKRKGYGKICVDILKEQFHKLEGESVLNAMGFWNKMGAVFNQDDMDNLINIEDTDSDFEDCCYLVSFTIN